MEIPLLSEEKAQRSRPRAAKRTIKHVAILGSGVMGSRIAAHFANIGVKVTLLDIVPRELNEAEKAQGLQLTDKKYRNRLVNDALQAAIKSNPAPLYDAAFASRITTGNFEDDMAAIKECDWVMEVVVENLDIKKKVFEQVEKHRTPGTLITSNTSGIPIHLMLEGRSDDFREHFCGVHFFNPPRYLKLLEIIPTPETKPEVVDFLMNYGDLYLGKTTVLAKDTPAFIANRVGVYSIMEVIKIMQELDLSVEEVDKLTGPVIGHAKSATFRTSDVVGLDTMIKVADNLYRALPNDESRGIFQVPDFVRKMEENKWLGDKTGQGFYKKTKKDGQTEILALDLKTLEYAPSQKAKFATLETTKSIDNLRKRFGVLLKGQDKAGEFYRKMFAGLFQYVTNRIPEIADELYKIDDALKAGFGWEMGPFETWDAIGLENGLSLLKQQGKQPAAWVEEMLTSGATSFYKAEGGQKLYYDQQDQAYKVIPGTEGLILLDSLRENSVVWKNSDATLFDLGDGILGLEFHTKMNTLGSGVIEGINKAISLAEKEYQGLVIGNEAANFSAGANLAMVFMFAIEQEYDELDLMIRQFQNTMMRVRYSSIPVVVAPRGLTLGGGCEMTMHADHVQAIAETYIGLVEMGVGLIPGGGGTKEFALRTSDSFQKGDPELNRLQNAYMDIAMAKVATSAHEARRMSILRDRDRITVNSSRQLIEAKKAALSLAEAGYTHPIQRTDIKVEGRTGIALFKAGVHAMRMGRYISEHDKKVAEKLAYVICGGDLSTPQEVSEQYLLDLEREAFLSLCGERKTLERIQAVLQTGKPIRN
ncbi:3-hydroxyacyl-CoA dehydrogenase [Catalinimonas alkaloidigena]|uniref:3-hydroxyacyl-CoA dehydrogenase n=1 Tax=Catalinimonas alkaloidigena TaxID=1075417 RepID=A0A1G9EVH5_9BACT|nr:3-hydroxyacyl-CoA dehydrogenase NAD-binding domain-containing protein [Catalinimonas alkaloidigena]SDK80134.1 3-hydroxyacyl-CoA dehydrogenase [Catalinimonas alkaloidigena]